MKAKWNIPLSVIIISGTITMSMCVRVHAKCAKSIYVYNCYWECAPSFHFRLCMFGLLFSGRRNTKCFYLLHNRMASTLLFWFCSHIHSTRIATKHAQHVHRSIWWIFPQFCQKPFYFISVNHLKSETKVWWLYNVEWNEFYSTGSGSGGTIAQ